MTPTATVFFISLTANLPRGGYWEKTSTHMGLVGAILTMHDCPDLTNLGNSSYIFPVLLSIKDKISSNLTAIWEVWQSKTGVYPF
jgi:hypothetical protein